MLFTSCGNDLKLSNNCSSFLLFSTSLTVPPWWPKPHLPPPSWCSQWTASSAPSVSRHLLGTVSSHWSSLVLLLTRCRSSSQAAVSWSASAVRRPAGGVLSVMAESVLWTVPQAWAELCVSAGPRCLTPRLLAPCQVWVWMRLPRDIGHVGDGFGFGFGYMKVWTQAGHTGVTLVSTWSITCEGFVSCWS